MDRSPLKPVSPRAAPLSGVRIGLIMPIGLGSRLLHLLLGVTVASAIAGCDRAGPPRPAISDSARPGTAPPADPPSQSPPDTLRAEDFTIVGVPLDVDSAWILRTFGRPDSVVVEDNPLDPGGKLPSWHYPDRIVTYTYSDTIFGMIVLAGRDTTRRGVGIGSSSAQVLAAYGPPPFGGQPDGEWEYHDPAQDLHILAFRLRQGRVAQLYFGYVLD